MSESNGHQFDGIRHPKQLEFLQAFAEMPMVKRAAKEAGIDRTTHYVWMKEEGEEAEAYQEAFANLKERVNGALEDEAFRRAVVGTKKTVFYQGVKCGALREFSDPLLKMLLQANMPHKYQERRATEITGRDGGPIRVVSAEALSDDELAHIAARGRQGIIGPPPGANGTS